MQGEKSVQPSRTRISERTQFFPSTRFMPTEVKSPQICSCIRAESGLNAHKNVPAETLCDERIFTGVEIYRKAAGIFQPIISCNEKGTGCVWEHLRASLSL